MSFISWDRRTWEKNMSLIGYWNVTHWYSLYFFIWSKKSLKKKHTLSASQGSYAERKDRPHSCSLINWKQKSHQIPSSSSASSPPPSLATLSSHYSVLFSCFCAFSFLSSQYHFSLLHSPSTTLFTSSLLLTLYLISHSNLQAEKMKEMTSSLGYASPPSLALKRAEKDWGVENVDRVKEQGQGKISWSWSRAR